MPPDNTVENFRLTQQAYAVLEKSTQAPFVGDKTTELQAGFQLGIQHVLKMLRDGYVIGA